MAFERLKELGDDMFGKILNALMRGEPAMTLARTIQLAPPKGWGLFQDVAEKTLTQQLNRLRQAAATGAFGKTAAKQIEAGATPQVKLLERVSVGVIARLEDLSNIQMDRINMMIQKEKMANVVYLSTNEVVEGYRKVLLDIQKVRFDLGLDEFKGPVGTSMAAMRGASVSTTYPDGTNVQKQVYEAVAAVEDIFTARRIPQLPPAR